MSRQGRVCNIELQYETMNKKENFCFDEAATSAKDSLAAWNDFYPADRRCPGGHFSSESLRQPSKDKTYKATDLGIANCSGAKKGVVFVWMADNRVDKV